MRRSRNLKRAAAAGLALAGAMTATVATAVPASAAAYNGVCGSGHVVVNSDNVGSKGTVYLTYNSNTGKNCVVTIRNNPGARLDMNAYIGPSDSPYGEQIVDSGDYTTYAGPVKWDLAGRCVDWGGYIDGASGGKKGTNCG
ncbi:spore-associated protein A [Streptomonospora wellingtoniae]|uniref:Spore-associated protein A n=1 Tax=Streptomonospora wellingtoniae TaxID=3075544 RepID=A0ABU2KZ69_9ACTN|nr:spore-associated protein A [Streptomonospora sp. DSM 45055]MDT0304592.1 spore-associated protein A [Streptomonospora sp. DSM 45055]